MKVDYFFYTSVPAAGVVADIHKIHSKIFKQADGLQAKMDQKPNLVIVIARKEDEIIGYKMGYELDEKMFCSWLGGVDPHYRNQGIAS